MHVSGICDFGYSIFGSGSIECGNAMDTGVFLGMTLFCLGTGMLFLVLSIQLYGKWIPTLIKNICQMARNLRDSVVKGKEA